jgi:hypothetical protein
VLNALLCLLLLLRPPPPHPPPPPAGRTCTLMRLTALAAWVHTARACVNTQAWTPGTWTCSWVSPRVGTAAAAAGGLSGLRGTATHRGAAVEGVLHPTPLACIACGIAKDQSKEVTGVLPVPRFA